MCKEYSALDVMIVSTTNIRCHGTADLSVSHMNDFVNLKFTECWICGFNRSMIEVPIFFHQYSRKLKNGSSGFIIKIVFVVLT